MSAAASPAPVERVPTLVNVIFSIKMFIAAMLAYFIAIGVDLQRPYWAVGTVFIVSHPLSGASTSKAVYRVIGTIVGGAMCVALVPNLVNSPELLTVAIAFWCGLCLFLSLIDRTPRSYVFMLSGYTTAITGTMMVGQPANSFDYAVSRVEEIALGVICAALVNRLIFPRHAGPVLAQRVNGWLANSASLIADSLLGRAEPERLSAERRRLAADAVDMRQFTTHIAYDTSHHQQLIRLSRALQQKMVVLLPILSALADQRAALNAVLGPSRTGRLNAVMAEIAGWITGQGASDAVQTARIRAELDRIEADHAGAADWLDLLSLNLLRRLRELLALWLDCDLLRAAIAGERVDPARLRAVLAAMTETPMTIERDYGMAFVAGCCTFATIVVANLLWIKSGWENGMYGAQLAGVFTCMLAFMDDPVPALRQMLGWLLVAMGAGFIYDFAILPYVDGFWGVAAALGLYLLPLGTLVAVPRLFLIGLTLCVNMPFMAMLQSTLNPTFVTVVEADIATVTGIILAIVMTRMIRSIGAEASARRLLHRAWAHVAANAGGQLNLSPVALAHRLVDILGLFAPRMAASAHAADISSADLILDLRVSVNVARLKERRPHLPAERALEVTRILEAVAAYYRARPSGARPDAVITLIDATLAARPDPAATEDERSLRTALAGLRLGLSPGAAPPFAATEPDARMLTA